MNKIIVIVIVIHRIRLDKFPCICFINEIQMCTQIHYHYLHRLTIAQTYIYIFFFHLMISLIAS